MKKLNIFLILSLVLLYPFSANAYVGLCCGKCGGNMPLNIIGGGIPETNEFRFKISYMSMNMNGLLDGRNDVNEDSLLGMPTMMGKTTGKFMAVPQKMDMSMYNLSIGYSFTDNFFGGLMLMYKNNSMGMKFSNMMKMNTGKSGYTMESGGVADTMLMTKYSLYTDDPLIPKSQVSLTFGLNLPTGSISEKNSNHPVASRRTEQLPYSMQLGSGTFDPKIGILYKGSSSPLWWGANFIYTGRWYDNARNYRKGDIYQLDMYSMYQLSYNLVANFQINGKKWTDISGEMDETASGLSGRSTQNDPSSPYMTTLFNPDNYGGKKLSLTAGMQWQPFPLHIIEVNAGIPLYQELNGPQLEEKYRFMLTWYIEFPTASSRRYLGKKIQGKSKLGF